MDNFEELDIVFDDAELEEVEKMRLEYPFPAITIGSCTVYISTLAHKILNDTGYIKYFLTPEYVIVLPATKTEKNAFKVTEYKKAHSRGSAIPAFIKNQKKVAKGTYKCLKYKDGLAFKRYEPVERFD